MKINGLPVVDSTKKFLLEITDSDVERGKNKNPAACAAALACKREMHTTDARVHLGRIYIKQGDKWIRFHTPQALRGEIIAFDRGGTFSAGQYLLSGMQPSKRTGKHQGGPNKPKRKRAKIARKYHVVEGVRAKGANR